MTIYIKGVSSSFPENVVENSFFGEALRSSTSPMFLGTRQRRHIGRDETAAELITKAIQKLELQGTLGASRNIDLILTNVSIPDEPFLGCGAVVAKKSKLQPKMIYDISNTGCIAVLSLFELADSLMQTHGFQSALLCAVQTAGGRVFAQETVRKKPQAVIPGDGCGIVYVTKEGGSQILATLIENHPVYADDMYTTFDDMRKYWEPGLSEGYLDFEEGKSARILMRGNKLVPDVIYKVCDKARLKTSDIDILITNQPNLYFLRNWREALRLKEEQHIHTFPKYANLFGAGIPVNLAEGIDLGMIKAGQLVCLAGFSHAGDYAGATLVRW